MSKSSKRKITVDLNTKPTKDQQLKPRQSVFERLGTKASTEYCRHWAQNGNCPYGKNCKYASTHTLISPSKQRAAVKKDGTIDTKKKLHVTNKDDPNKRLHSTIVKAGRNSEVEWDNWDQTDLEYADADALEKRRQELQRQLELQLKMESKQVHKKDKKPKKCESSSSSTGSSSTSSESSSSSDDSSSVSSSSSKESHRRKLKKTKTKQQSSSSSDEVTHKKKLTPKTVVAKRTNVHAKLPIRHRENIIHGKKLTETNSPARKVAAPKTPPSKLSRSPTPRRPLSTTPPLKTKSTTPSKPGASIKANIKTARSSRSIERKDRKGTPSPRPPTRNRDRDDKDKHKLREKEREREREIEREKEREKEKEREREKEKLKERDRNHEKDRDQTKLRVRERSLTPKKDIRIKDIRKKDSPDNNLRDRSRGSPNRLHNTINRRREDRSPIRDDRRSDRSRDDDRKKDKDRSMERNHKDDKNIRRHDDRDNRQRERDPKRMTREEREAAREKEREEALARCQERQRERERLKKMAEKDREMHLRNRERERDRDRGLDKPSSDKVERLLPLPSERIPPSMRMQDLDRSGSKTNDRRDKSVDRNSDRSFTRDRSDRDRLSRRPDNRNYDHAVERTYRERGYERERDADRGNERDYPTRHDSERRTLHSDDKSFDSPYDSRRLREDRHYIEPDNERYEDTIPIRDSHHISDYSDDRRTRSETWDEREIRDVPGHRTYVRDNSRPPAHKGREWEKSEYINNRHEWSERSGTTHDWEERGREDWDQTDRPTGEEEWRGNYENWPNDERRPRNWSATEWNERSGVPKRPPISQIRPSKPIVRDEKLIPQVTKEEIHVESRRIVPKSIEHDVIPQVDVIPETPNRSDLKKDNVTITYGKRNAESPAEGVPEPKKQVTSIVAEPIAPLEADDLSEISDDADEILNREDDLQEIQSETIINQETTTDPLTTQTNDTQIVEVEQQNSSDIKPISPTTSVPVIPNNNEVSNLQTDQHSVDEEAIDQMDFEEISDEELEEETKVKGLGDALGVDWASLVAESRPRIKVNSSGSAKKRWEPHRVLARIGISIKMAGPNLAHNILNEIENKNEKSNENEVKIELENSEKLEVHPIAGMQVSLREWTIRRRQLFASAGPFKRALCARRDLEIRKYLCKLPIKDTIGLGDTQHTHDPELFRMALKLYERTL